MLKSRKIAGKHFEFVCSECHKTIPPNYIFDLKCPHCKSKMSAGEGEPAVCIGNLAYGCIADCPHRKKHYKRTGGCRMFYCKAVGHMTACTYQPDSDDLLNIMLRELKF